MVNINDKAGIFKGKRLMLKPDEKKALKAIGWLVTRFPQQLKEALKKQGWTFGPSNDTAYVQWGQAQERKALVQGVLHMIKTGNKQFAEDVGLIIQGKRFSSFDPATLFQAFGVLGNIFGSGQQNDEDLTNEIIALQAEKEKTARMQNALIFGGLAVLGIVAVAIIVKVNPNRS